MATRKKPKFDAFVLALRQMNVAQLKRLAAAFKKGTSNCQTADDYVHRLDLQMQPSERLTAMRDFILAGQTSMSIYALEIEDDAELYEFETDFDGTASREPAVVTVGKPDELIKGQQHVQWAIIKGQQSFLDIHLSLKVEPESMIVDTFFEKSLGFLQIRASAMYAKRIAIHWAKLAGVDFEKTARCICLTSPKEVDEFATQLGGTIRKCGGNKKESNGFLRVSGTRHPNLKDLRGTKDYTTFLDEVDPCDFQIEFSHDKKTFALSVSIDAGSIYFMTAAPEKTIQYVYSELKKYLKA